MTKKTLTTLAALGLLASNAAFAADTDAELEALKRELAAQRKLIEQLLAGQAPAPKSPTDTSEFEQKLREGRKAPSEPSTPPPVAPPSTPQVKFYGVADMSVNVANSGMGTKARIDGSGGYSNSRLGVQVTSTVGRAKVTAVAEAGVQFDTGETGASTPAPGINVTAPSSGGTPGGGPQIFGRQIWGGIDVGFGQISIGRQYTGSYIQMSVIGNVHGDGLYGNSATLLPNVGGMPTRANSSIVWATPQVASLRGIFTYTTGSENNISGTVSTGTTSTTSKAGQGYDLMGIYSYAAGEVAMSAWNLNNASFVTAGETALAKRKGFQLSANYDFGPFKIFGEFIHGTISGGNYEEVTKTLSKSSGYGLSVLVPMANSRIMAGWSRLQDRSALNKDASLYGISYMYDLSSNTILYATAGKLLNNHNSNYALLDGGNLDGNVTRAGFDPAGIEVGWNFKF